MVSTRQMCGSAGAAGSADAAVVSASSNNHVNIAVPFLEETATRTSVVRRTTNYNNHQPLVTTSPASLAFSASVTRQHSYILQSGTAIASNANANDSDASSASMNFLDLPPELIIKVLTYLDYKKISNLRLVSNRMNDICKSILNSAFSRMINTTYNRFHNIKASMPRRESARRSHPLACECDIIETCYMRLSLLQMSMGKHIERGHCCFFPGAILDEVNSILNYISITPRLQRPYRVTDELFDLSTMAMEYFKDRIEPTLPDLAFFNRNFYSLPTTTKRPTLAITSDLADSPKNSPPQNHMVLRKGIRKIKQGMKIYNNQLSVLRADLRTCKRKAAEQSKQLSEQQNLIAEHQKQTLEYANRLDENDKKNEEMTRKFSTLLQELNKCKTELQFWRSKSPAIPSMCSTCNVKVAPLLPAEDFQALVNQGVDPEHIIINDDTDAGCELPPMTLENEFVFPDESTTAKLLAVNTAAKNLKRKFQTETETETAGMSNIIASIATPSTSKAAAADSFAMDAAATPQPAVGGGCSTKLFYGNHQPRSGVIVSPVSMKFATVNVPSMQQQPTYAGDTMAADMQVGVTGAACGDSSGADQEESKKARRVQKATRCVNTHGKRSK